MNNTSKKLIAVIDSRHLVLYEGRGIRVLSGPNNIELPWPHHERPEKGHGSYDTDFGRNVSASTPHTMPKEIDNTNAAKMICSYLDELFRSKSEYQELIICANPKMLGNVRENLSKQLKSKITKEVDKDLINEDKTLIEKIIFG